MILASILGGENVCEGNVGLDFEVAEVMLAHNLRFE